MAFVVSKMWSQIFLCVLLVGYAYASASASANNPAWKPNTEYTYHVHTVTASGIHDISDDRAGVLIKAQMTIQPKPNGHLSARISNAEYAQVHAELPTHVRHNIDKFQVSYKPLGLSNKPFEIVTSNGVIRDLIVSKDISNWQTNIIKSFVSQLQVDTNAQNLMPSGVNVLPEEGQDTATYKTIEETVTGSYQTLYEIHPVAEFILQSEPWLVPLPNLKGGGKVYEIIKTKNYSQSYDRPSYHYGFAGIDNWEPAGSKAGDFFTRHSISRVIATGNLNHYTIQNTYTINSIVLSPGFNDQQKGSTVSSVHFNLTSVKAESGKPKEVENPVSLGGLVYQFNDPAHPTGSGSGYGRDANSKKFLRGYTDDVSENFNDRKGRYYDEEGPENEQYTQQAEQPLSEAPYFPMLPYSTGVSGESVKTKINVVEQVQKLAQQIGQELQQPNEMPRYNTPSKFITLCSLVRIMDAKEIQQAASNLYCQDKEGLKQLTWATYRDAVAAAGTGPALFTIDNWLESRKIKEHEAADVVATTAQSVRRPSLGYMKKFYIMITKPAVQSQHGLNQTAILAYTELLYHVYVNKRDSHKQFPVHVYGQFRTKDAAAFLINEVTPYLTQQLHKAIDNGETERIHLYIRALGNTGHQMMLPAFEPYLECKKQASQFQRLLMVLAMDHLVQANPRLAASVLYKIYRNPGEEWELRVSAVAQLMRTAPPTETLQRMAAYTHVDTDNHVNSIVQSAINSAAKLDAPALSHFRSAALSAQPLLTKKSYGYHYSKQYLDSYVTKSLPSYYKQIIQSLGSEDAYLPKGLRYSLYTKMGGVRQHVITVQSIVSSIDELWNFYQENTRSYQQQQQNKKPSQSQYSSETFAESLKLQNVIREQFEGNFFVQMGALQKFHSYDNNTLEDSFRWYEVIEEGLRSGKAFQSTKASTGNEFAVAFPLETGFPFLYTNDEPYLSNIGGKIKFTANPKFFSKTFINKPDTVDSEAEFSVLAAGKMQSQFGFTTPFDQERYIAGYDKSFQIYLPVFAKIHIDLKSMQMQYEVEQRETGKAALLLFYSTEPYTAKYNLLTLSPGITDGRKIIKNKHQNKIDKVYGQSAGLALNLRVSSDQRLDYIWLARKYYEHDKLSAFLSTWGGENVQYIHASLFSKPEQATTNKVVVYMIYRKRYQERADKTENPDDFQQFSKLSSEPSERQKEIFQRVAANIHNAEIKLLDFSVEFQGEKTIKYAGVISTARSLVNPIGRATLYFKKTDERDSAENNLFIAVAKTYIPQTIELNMNEAIDFDTKAEGYLKIGFGKQLESRILMNMKYDKTEERKQYLKQHPFYAECQREMQQGNYQQYACANMTVNANLLDHLVMKLKYENLSPEFVNKTRTFYHLVGLLTYFHGEEYIMPSSGVGENESVFESRYDSYLDQFNANFAAGKIQREHIVFNGNSKIRALLLPHPGYYGKSYGIDYFYDRSLNRPICVVDKTVGFTLDGKRYPLNLNKKWTVLLQYIPQSASYSSKQKNIFYPAKGQLQHEVRNYIVLVRDSATEGDSREVKMTVNVPDKNNQILEITVDLLPSAGGSGQKAKVVVNGKEVSMNKGEQGEQLFDGQLQINHLQNGEVQVEFEDTFVVVYDGQHIKLSPLTGLFRNSVRGLCGTFTGDKTTDFQAPDNCILRNAEEFISSYTEEPKPRTSQHCVYKERVCSNVISNYDAGRQTLESKQGYGYGHQSPYMCTMHQTRYVINNDDICFTLRPIPQCKPECQARRTVTEEVPVHCVKNNKVASLWKTQIDKGASPDFMDKSESMTIPMEVPQQCSP